MARGYKITRKFFIPTKNAEEVHDEEAKAVVYKYKTLGSSPFAAMGFGGRRQRPDWNYRFPSEDARAKYIDEYFAAQHETLAMKATRRMGQGTW